ncbi:hypothetical protein [Bradyrhizobium viridifuturi]|uniref:hypothetical protein n=1 Tax=Bradyrhizobium viridifuturi TaxID=1654716 RepID=UPI000B0FCB5F|nr:hypothetical protein [Bradyrhizobium viridifuturi]
MVEHTQKNRRGFMPRRFRSKLICRKAPSGRRISVCSSSLEEHQNFDTILVVIAVTMMFATVAFVIAYGDRQTRNL